MRFVWYEDMKEDIRREVLSTCSFINHPLSAENLEKLLDHISFNSMKNNPSVNIPRSAMQRGDFIRKGEVGDSKNFFSQERDGKWDEWIREKLHNTTMKMPGI